MPCVTNTKAYFPPFKMVVFKLDTLSNQFTLCYSKNIDQGAYQSIEYDLKHSPISDVIIRIFGKRAKSVLIRLFASLEVDFEFNNQHFSDIIDDGRTSKSDCFKRRFLPTSIDGLIFVHQRNALGF